MDEQQRKDWDRLTRTLGAGFLVRWDQYDPGSLEQEVGPVTRGRPGPHEQERERERVRVQELEEAWFD